MPRSQAILLFVSSRRKALAPGDDARCHGKGPRAGRAPASLAACAAIVALLAGCGDKQPANTPAGVSNVERAPEGTTESGSAPGADSTTGERSTTTLSVPDGGDLQGSKLSSSSSRSYTTTESGPKSSGQAEPGRSVEDIRVRVAAVRDEARACYEKALPKHPGMEGDLDVKWTIDPEGNVVDAQVDTTKSTILDPSVGQCVIAVLKKLKYAKSNKGFETRAHYPFNFHPKVGGQADAGS